MMNSSTTNHDKFKNDLTRELEIVLKAALASQHSSKENIASEITQNICNVLEAMFIHGLRDPFFLKGSRYSKYPEPNFWPFVSKFTHRNITSQIQQLKMIKSEIGKGRAWIRILLNECSMEHYLHLLVSEKKALDQFYHEFAFIRDPDHVDRLRGHLKALSRLPFSASTNSSLLNAWTPSPLILAGLVAGKPLRVGALAPRRRVSWNKIDSDEVGTSALDLLPQPVQTSPVPHKERRSRRGLTPLDAGGSEDECSVYSHPSLLNNECEPRLLSSMSNKSVGEANLPFSSTPIENSALEEEHQDPSIDSLIQPNLGSLLVSRRSKRPRRSSRSNSNSTATSKSASTGDPTGTVAGTLPELDECLLETRMKQSETLDSGVESENRDGNASGSGGQSDICSSYEAIRPTETSEGHIKNDENILEKQHEINDDEVFVENERTENSADLCNNLSSLTIDSSNNVTNAMDISHPLNKTSDTMFGTSLHDELIYVMNESPIGNSVLGGGWTPSAKCDWADNSLDDESWRRTSSSSGNETDSTGRIISFDQALRSAIEAHHEDATLSDVEQEASSPVIKPTDSEASNHLLEDDIYQKLTCISTSKGLDQQDFRCPMCRKSIGASFSRYSTCGIDGMNYCTDCMKGGGDHPIPARVVLSWDWTSRSLSDRGRTFIESNLDKPVIDLERINPTIYDHVIALNNVKNLREKLKIVVMYLLNCRQSISDDFSRRIWPKEYLYSDVHLYSFSDLISVHSGLLEKRLNALIKFAIDHVLNCLLCKQKGFFCEVCHHHDVIYPFQTESTHRCSVCYSVFHSACIVGKCPKCERRQRYEQNASQLPLDD